MMSYEKETQLILDIRAKLDELERCYIVRTPQIDDDLGLEVVQKQSIKEKYKVNIDPTNSFHESLQEFFDKTGFLTPKQLSKLSPLEETPRPTRPVYTPAPIPDIDIDDDEIPF